ncbi:FAD-dependent oxidoreductase [Effusibacillus lacus]|uniref:L-aspartate oxidase n=1 Tax=Effusibacillus lacus TaxID=1348429 RepID=A0A292YLR5_9BACL|nr:FAD-dependent oxidoreductase [Effusibacillus lacus]TCS71601.1 L-aspartate oxidase/fumarate reductase (CoM/CoB) subunit A [Effusibacillus lacus]GAX90106.1 fumarate reductase subunit A [Effusibacillus lacus]
MKPAVIVADVLVIGGGQAALRASIEARRQGAKVVMVSKGQIGTGGSSAISDTVHSAILAPGDSAEIFYQDIVKGGKQVNKPELALALATDCTERVQELQQEFGVQLHFERELVTPGHSFPRRCYHKSGLGVSITRKLREYAEKIGVIFYEKTWIVDLLSDRGRMNPDGISGEGSAVAKGRILGAIGISSDEWMLFIAGNTILAAGGIGRIYAHSDNPIDITGEAIGMAWRHGAELQDMEFIQFYPYRLISPINIDLYTKLFAKGAVMRNEQGTRFLEGYPRKELETRDIVCYEMFKQGRVLLDISQVSDQDLKETSPRLHALLAKEYQGELVVQPVEHYSIGGISIDASGRTGLPGLYACGECTGGVHGANRLGGGALTEALVFGTRAGFAAVTEATTLEEGMVREVVREFVPSESPRSLLNPETKALMLAVRKHVQEIMWNQVGIERSLQGLEQAYTVLSKIAQKVRHHLPLLNMVQTASIVARSAYVRQESRGAHQVIDFPGERDEWRGNLIVHGEELTFRSLS